MKIIPLKCNHCSADLEIPEHTNFFTCSFCKSSLGIKRSGNAVFTEVLSEIKEDTNQIIDISENILVEKQIARLDRDWEKTKESFTTYREGTPSLPDDSSSGFSGIIFGSILGLIGLAFFISLISPSIPTSDGQPIALFFSLFILLGIIIFSFISIFSLDTSAQKYKAAKTTYEEKRQALLKQLEEG